ncbi:MAG: sulfatase [Acidobacteria bacterium]|nr:sulfatase [Acidobacteriota bacterium]
MTRRSFISTTALSAAAAQQRPRNIIFILTDDHRYDAMGFLKGQSFLETPHLDAMARNGIHVPNAFVTTALCSPSRASILTGQYAHKHRVVDNNNPVPPGTKFFPELLQKKANYQTGFFGKWHMGGEGDDPQPGFDKWVSFRGQGTYSPTRNGLNIDGKKVPQKGYITDELTDYALDWLGKTDSQRPFFMYLSHKATHSEFEPAARHKGKFANAKFVYPKSYAPAKPEQRLPMWVQNQRNSWHGVEYPYHSKLDIEEYYKRYAETLCAVDDSVGRVMDALRSRNQLESTLVIYMGDNGFAFGEHGLIDKRTAYEESMRVPMLLQCPELFGRGKKLNEVIANIDIAPTCLEAAGVKPEMEIQGKSFLGLAQGKKTEWRDGLLYEYYWERNFPQTPTVHAIRGDRYKYIRYQGLWDLDELYDLQNDPLEMQNLIESPQHKSVAIEMNKKLFAILESTGGMYIPLNADRTLNQSDKRNGEGSKAAQFPASILK